MDQTEEQGFADARPADLELMIGGERVAGTGTRMVVRDKFTGAVIAEGATAGPEQMEAMIAMADTVFRAGAPGPNERGAILTRAAEILRKEADVVAEIITAESGFTGKDAAGEVTRCLETLRLSAEEARRLSGDVIPIEGAPGQSGRFAFTMRVPLGVVLAVTPFNSPLNTVAHKLAPAFAAGNAVIAKPASATPMTTLALADILTRAGVPKGFLSVLLANGPTIQPVVEDPRIRFIAFTGSTEAGRAIQSSAGLRQTQMELGSIAFTVLCDDADLERAVPRIVGASFRKAGQVCTSVQIALIHRARFDEARDRLEQATRGVRFGDPRDPDVLTGPLISEREAIRVESWIEEAVAQGAKRLVGGPRVGSVVPPTLLTDLAPNMNVCCNEVFGPVLCLVPFDTEDEAIAAVNATPYGLATGIFTRSLESAFRFARQLEVGGVHINETSSSRVDLMPYGGSKDSGFGREGPHYAVREMTEERIVTIST